MLVVIVSLKSTAAILRHTAEPGLRCNLRKVTMVTQKVTPILRVLALSKLGPLCQRDVTLPTRDNSDPSLSRQANAEAVAARGLAPPILPSNIFAITHTGEMVSDFHNRGLFVGAYPDLFPHGVGGHLDERQRPVTFEEWGQITLGQRDPRFRKHRSYLFNVCALIFRREAIQNARWKLTGTISNRTSKHLPE